jgi:hypothetical protein
MPEAPGHQQEQREDEVEVHLVHERPADTEDRVGRLGREQEGFDHVRRQRLALGDALPASAVS